MATQRNAEGKNEGGPGARVGVKRKVGGTQRRSAGSPAGTPSSGRLTTGRAVTTSGGGGTGGRPETERERQDAAQGRVHGQPPSGFKSRGTEPIPQGDEGGYA